MEYYSVIQIVLTFGISLILGFVCIPLILAYCKKKQLYDIPNARKIHKTLIPRLGGICFMPSMLVSFILAVAILGFQYKGNIIVRPWSIIFFVSLLIIYVTGFVDDFIGLSPKVKFIAQIVAAILLTGAGLYINDFYGFFGIHGIPAWVGIPLTVFVIVFICNAINLIDGIDGLAASLTEIALGGFFVIYYKIGLFIYCILIAGLMGVLLAYLYFNMFGSAEKGKKIFMGDSGSLTLGFVLAFLAVKLCMDNPRVMPTDPLRMPYALTLLVVPIFDVARVIIHRLRTHRPIFKADKNHIHHKLMRYGLTMRQSLAVIVILALCFIVLNLFILRWTNFTIMFITDVIIYTLFNITLDKITINKLKRNAEARA